jgi:hypothetical protein
MPWIMHALDLLEQPQAYLTWTRMGGALEHTSGAARVRNAPRRLVRGVHAVCQCRQPLAQVDGLNIANAQPLITTRQLW